MPTMTEETKQWRVSPSDVIVEVRKADKGMQLFGYAARFDSLSENLGGFREVIRRGAFSRSLAESPDVSARIQHEGGMLTIGRTTNGSLRLKEDDNGLFYEVDLPNTGAGRDIFELVSKGYIDKSSFAFSLRDDGEQEPQRWHFDQDPALRELFNVNLHDVAPVDGPAYQQTSVSVRDGAKDEFVAAQLARHKATVQAIRELQEWGHAYRWGLT